MIGMLRGNIEHVGGDYLILNAGGVGYKVFCSADTLNSAEENQEMRLWTYLAVRETALDLFGFLIEEELRFFELLLNVPGIGPKSALAVLNIAPVDVLASAIHAGDSSYLTKVSGVGKKSAEKIVLELKDKVAGLIGVSTSLVSRRDDLDTIEALKALGYSSQDAREALKEIDDEVQGVNDRLRAALQILGKK